MKLSITLLLSIVSWSILQTDYEKEIQMWQQEINETFADKVESPLDKKAVRKFKGLDFFPIDEKYYIEADFIRTPNELPFSISTTAGGKQIYEKFGEAHFTLDSQSIVLSLYQNNRLSFQEAYKDYLFLPFTDQTNGYETYGGGRYIDLSIPQGDKIVVDFNKAYNPSCAYNAAYACPIPPKENDISIPILAGIKSWDD